MGIGILAYKLQQKRSAAGEAWHTGKWEGWTRGRWRRIAEGRESGGSGRWGLAYGGTERMDKGNMTQGSHEQDGEQKGVAGQAEGSGRWG